MKFSKIYISALCMLSLSLNSCDAFLEEEPLHMKGSEQFWKTKTDAETAVNALYFGGVPYLHNKDIAGGWTPKATMWGGNMSGLFSDTKRDRPVCNAMRDGIYTVEMFDETAMSFWHEFYKGISRANFVIANVPKMTSVLTPDEIANYVAQAKFFRAYGYYSLVKEFGDVPYISEPYTSTNGMYVERMPAAQVYANVEKDLTDALAGNALPNVAFYDNKCKVTKPMAQTLLAQVYLQWAGAPLNGGNEYYTKAANMAKEVINGGQHELIQKNGSKLGLESAFNEIKTTESSNEIIFAKEYNYSDYNVGNSYCNRCIDNAAAGWQDAEGNGVFKQNIIFNAYEPCDMLLQSFAPEDIRGQEKQWFFKEYTDKTGVSHTSPTWGIWAWFDEDALINKTDGDYNVPMMRYAEVLLIAAEGLARTGNESETDGAKFYLNQVRKRAGLAPETATGNELIESILTERLHEFATEFKIWDDIRRTRLYPEASTPGKLKWSPLATATLQNKPANRIEEFALVWPIPLSEMQANPALEGHQNEGWN